MKDQDKTKEELILELQELQQKYNSLKISTETDIRERELAKSELRESEEKFRSITEQTNDLIAITDTRGTITYASPSSKPLFQFDPEEMWDRNFIEFLDEADIPKAFEHFSKSIESGERVKNLELKMKRKDGSLFIGELNGSNFRFGTQNGTIVNIRDISERKKAEEKLKTLEQQSHAWLENSPACTKIVDIDFNLQFMSRAGIEGLKIDDITPYYGKPYPFHFYPESFKTKMTGNMKMAIETGEVITQEAPVLDINGNEIWFHSTIVPTKDDNGRIEYLIIVSMDTTEQKQAEEKLKESEHTFRKLFEESSDAILLIDETGVFVECNQAALDILKMTREQFLFLSPANISPEFQPNGDLSEELAKEMIEHAYKKGLHRFDWTHINADGDEFIVDISLMPIVVKRKTMLHTTWRDITDRKRVEEELIKAKERAEESERNLQFRNEEYEAINEELLKTNDELIAAKERAEESERNLQFKNEEYEAINEELLKTNDELIAAKERAEESEEKLNSVLINLSDVVWSISYPDLTHNFISPSLEKLYGRSKQDLLDNPNLFQDITHPDDKHLTEKAMKQLLEEGKAERECRIIKPDGSIVWVNDRSKMIYDEYQQPIRVDGVTSDITERKQAEEKLKESEVRFKAVIDSLPLAVHISTELEQNTRYLNPSMVNMFGYTPEEILSVSEWWPLAYPDKDYQEWVSSEWNARVAKALETNSVIEPMEVICTCKDGTQKNIRWAYITAGGINYSLGLDITERKQAEQELIKAKERAEKSEEKYRLLTEFAADVVWVINLTTGKFDYISPSVFQLRGFTVKEAMNEKFEDTLTPESLKIVRDAITKDTKYFIEHPETNNYYINEIQQICKNGQIIWVEVSTKFRYNQTGEIEVVGVSRNIDERKQAEEKLKTSDRIFKHSMDMLCIAGFDGYFKVLNPAWTKILGWSNEELLSNPWIDFVHPDDRDNTTDIKSVIVDGKEVYQFENRYICKDGTIKWLSWTSFPYPEENIMFGVARDVTERKHNEEDLQKAKEKAEESERQLNYSQKVARIGYYIFNIQTGLWSSSEMLDEIFGINNDYVRDVQGWLNLIHPDFQKIMLDYLSVNILSNHEKFDKSYQIINKQTNQTYWVNGLGTLEFDKNGKILKMFGTIQDISISKEFEQELIKAKEKAEESEEKFKVVVENGAALMTITDTQGIVVFASPQCENVIGWPIADVIGLNIPDFIHPDDKEMVIAEQEKATALKPIKDFEYRIFDKQKNIRWVSHSASFIKNGDGFYILSTIMNITDRKQAEQELIKAKERAEESDRLKSAFLANMSHEIRTPMNGILGFALLLKEPGLSGDEQREYITTIEKSGKRMLNIINDIIDISKIESGLMNINISESNINEQIEYIYTFFKPEVEAKGMKLSFRNTLPSNEAVIKTDREKIFAILTNLVKNSIKYSQKGFIEFGYNKKGNTLEFFVKDTGIGIPKDRQSGIFERFIQGDIEDKMARQGAGLGLAITKAYTEMLDGRIWVESQEGKGSTFYFTIPYNPLFIQEITCENDGAFDVEPLKLNLEILIAEDDETSEMLLEIMVNMSSKHIIKAKTGVEAIEVCRNNPDIDLILMDIQMPEMNGLEATRQIRKFNKEVIIIAQTAYGLTGDREKALESGCNDYISKPISKLELHTLMQKYFRK